MGIHRLRSALRAATGTRTVARRSHRRVRGSGSTVAGICYGGLNSWPRARRRARSRRRSHDRLLGPILAQVVKFPYDSRVTSWSPAHRHDYTLDPSRCPSPPIVSSRPSRDCWRVRRNVLYAPEGRQVLDGSADLVREHQTRPSRDQGGRRAPARTLDYARLQMGTRARSSSRTASLRLHRPDSIGFFVTRGPEAVDTALKIAIGSRRLRGEPSRTRSMAASRLPRCRVRRRLRRRHFPPNREMWSTALLPGTIICHRRMISPRHAFTRGHPAHGAHLTDTGERIRRLARCFKHCRMIVEPHRRAGPEAALTHGYLERLHEISDRHGFSDIRSGRRRIRPHRVRTQESA